MMLRRFFFLDTISPLKDIRVQGLAGARGNWRGLGSEKGQAAGQGRAVKVRIQGVLSLE